MSEHNEQHVVETSEQIQVRREKLQALYDKGGDPWGTRFDITATTVEIEALGADKTKEELASWDSACRRQDA